MVELHDERDAMRILTRNRPEHAVRGCHCVTTAFDGELHDVLRIEVRRVLGKRRAGRVLDSLVNGENREVPRTTETPVVEDGLQEAQYANVPIRANANAVDNVGARQMQILLRHRATRMIEHRRRLVTYQYTRFR